LRPEEVDLIKCLAKARFASKRVAGIDKTRSDGSICSEDTDVQATAAEYFAAQYCGVPFNAGVSTKGDGGADFVVPLSVEVVHLGMVDGKARRSGHLIINPHEPQRWADIYLVVVGSLEEGFEVIGWIPHEILVQKPMKDFGYGMRYAVNIDALSKKDFRKLRRN
jgi:hypothetical protein